MMVGEEKEEREREGKCVRPGFWSAQLLLGIRRKLRLSGSGCAADF